MRHLFAMQALEGGKSFGRHLLGRPQGPMTQYGSGMLMNGDFSGTGKVGQ